MRFASAFACVLCLGSFAAAPAIAQDSGGASPPASAAVNELPAVEVVQDTPAKKAAQAKKKAVAVSPLTSVSGPPTGGAPASANASQTGLPSAPVAGPITVPSAVTNVTDADIEHEGTGSIQQTL